MINLLQADIQISIQDLGRKRPKQNGFYGGAVDRQALILANRLLGNQDNSPTLEFCARVFCKRELSSGALVLYFQQTSWIALTGADFDARVEDRPLRSGWRAKVNAGERLFIHGPKTGIYGYLAILGGIANISGMTEQAGGSLCKHLKADACLSLNPPKNQISRPIGVIQRVNDGILRALPGAELDLFTTSSRKSFWAKEWILAAQSSRSAAFLEGESLSSAIKIATQTALAPNPNLPGTVQVSEQGKVSISLADNQNTGNYPVIARVIEADLWKVAQRQPGQRFTFEHVSPNQVESANYEWQQYFERLARMLHRNS
ncbi:biotin-dependent carboxyltransferase family protein [Shewanella sp. AS1]|uniref:5-oxoprolinase subunit C family protein n=1 Tax=Shewanella sp. AS1 TaxID=2907626 RepID=UPI001F2F134F|nr:biotin-dependent carboxyltransferase family protein [Shewanella sp. AS1]MCE9679661.1 biotin-dependent carboxyltransferase family protein [Shewanella sp. AS1]